MEQVLSITKQETMTHIIRKRDRSDKPIAYRARCNNHEREEEEEEKEKRRDLSRIWSCSIMADIRTLSSSGSESRSPSRLLSIASPPRLSICSGFGWRIDSTWSFATKNPRLNSWHEDRWLLSVSRRIAIWPLDCIAIVSLGRVCEYFQFIWVTFCYLQSQLLILVRKSI